MIRNPQSLVFFFLFAISLVGFLYFPSSLFFWILSFLFVIGWKLLSGLSWVNFSYAILGLIEVKILALWLSPVYLSLFTLGLLILLFSKIFLPFSKPSVYLILYYLLLTWIFISFGFYFLSSFPFIVSFLSYLGGTIIFLFLISLIKQKIAFQDMIVLLLLEGEIFWLISYLSIKILPLSLLTFMIFWLLMREYWREETN